jgi:hypothetical protein
MMVFSMLSKERMKFDALFLILAPDIACGNVHAAITNSRFFVLESYGG